METQLTTGDLAIAAEARASETHRSPESVAQILNRMRLTKMRAVEALSVAIRYFSRFPNVALCFAGQAADEARHLAALTGRVIELDGTFSPNASRSELLGLLPGFKVDALGGTGEIAEFVCQFYMDKQAELLFWEATTRSLEDDKLTHRIVSRIARDERLHLASIRILLDKLAREGHLNEVGASLVGYGQSSILVS